VRAKDGKEMVLIPTGAIIMGSEEYGPETPQRTMTLKGAAEHLQAAAFHLGGDLPLEGLNPRPAGGKQSVAKLGIQR